MKLAQTKNFLLTGAALTPVLGLAGASGANAADMALKAPPPIAAPSWAGFYLGVNIGGAAEASYYADPNGIIGDAYTPSWRNGAALIGGGQIGYNWQQGTFVYGLEADISGLSSPSGLNFAAFSDPHYTYGSHIPWLATIRGRAGVTVGDGMTLLYGTGGVAIGSVKAFNDECFYGGEPCNNYSATRTGWAAGGGVERMITPHWTIGLEGLFVDLGSYTKAANNTGKCCATVHNTAAIGRFKLDFKF